MTTLINKSLSKEWEAWCRRGKHGVGNKRRAAIDCLDKNGNIRGWYSDIVLDPTRNPKDSLYPSIEHVNPRDSSDIKAEARIFNDMKSHLTKEEFWLVVDHLYSIGIEKGEIKNSEPRRLPTSWKPLKNY